MTRRQHTLFNLGSYQGLIENALIELRDNQVISRIWAHDHTVWKSDPTEITNRLGWLHSPQMMGNHIERLETLVGAVRHSGYTHALLLGMGGSSLAAEVFRKTFGVKEGYLDLAVLDSTDPETVLAHSERLDPDRTLFVVSTKSGTTVETLSFFKFFYRWVSSSIGEKRTGEHFIAITDPGTPLTDLAERYRFRNCFLNDPNIGGRYSALSYFGLVPAMLIGMDPHTLLARAMDMVCNCDAESNNGGSLGVLLGDLAKAGRDKVTFISSPQITSFGDWVEQLIAESTGKEGKGILPVVGEGIAPPAYYGDDRLFVNLCLKSDNTYDRELAVLERAGHPIVRLALNDRYDLGGQFFLWEMAVAVAGHRLEINPFNQPDVEAAKSLARQVTTEYREKGSLPDEMPALSREGIDIYGDITVDNPGLALISFLEQAKPGGYIALQAYLPPAPEMDSVLQAFRTRIRDRFRLATTIGYGPRFLHSTGQLHKGDAGHGLFVQFTADDQRDASIPDEAGSSASSMSFGVLKAAQAIGDYRALMKAGRKVIRFHLGRDAVRSLQMLNGMVSWV